METALLGEDGSGDSALSVCFTGSGHGGSGSGVPGRCWAGVTCLAPLRLHRINGLSNRTIGCGHAESGRDRTGEHPWMRGRPRGDSGHRAPRSMEGLFLAAELQEAHFKDQLGKGERHIFGALEHRIRHSMQLGRCNIATWFVISESSSGGTSTVRCVWQTLTTIRSRR